MKRAFCEKFKILLLSNLYRKTERKVVLLQRQLEALQHREQMAQETLSEVLKVVSFSCVVLLRATTCAQVLGFW